MNLDALTEKIYREGIEKANKESDELLENAKKESEKIIREAREKADKIIHDANKETEEIKKNAISDIRLAGDKAIITLRQEIRKMIGARVIDEPFKKLFSDTEFLKKLILAVVEKSDLKTDAEIRLPEKMREDMEKALEGDLRKQLNGLEITFDTRLSGGFQIHKKDEEYLITFTDADFAEFFKPFLNKKTGELLF
jgi:V/A-type H+/Na+-transporting ATPase subunit E